MIRTYGELDFLQVKNIWEKHYSKEFDVDTSNTFAKAVVGHFDKDTNTRKITGFGLVRNIAEVIMLLDKDKNKYTNGKDFIDLLHHAVLACAVEGHNQLHAFVKDEEFSEILKKHFGFKVIEGEGLVLNIE